MLLDHEFACYTVFQLYAADTQVWAFISVGLSCVDDSEQYRQ